MDDGRVRVGFVGVGNMGQCAHLRNYAVLRDECEVAALAELRANTGAEVARRYGIPKVYASAGEMLASEALDALVASQPFVRHGVVLTELLPFGLPVFIEKPLAGNLQVAETIMAEIARHDGRVMVGYHKRSDPATEYATARIRALQESGELGRMTYIRILMPAGDWIAGGFDQRIALPDETPALAWDPPAEDMDEATAEAYTSFVNYYIHQVNLLRFLLGEPYQVTFAEDTGVLFVGRSDSGIPVTIEMSPYQTTIDWQEHALVCFEKGYVRLDLPAPLAANRPGQVEILRDPGDGATPVTERPHLPWEHAMKRQARNFLRFARGEADAPCQAAEALEDLRLARAYIRLKTGQ